MALFRRSEEKIQSEELELLRQEILAAKMEPSAEEYALKELEKLKRIPPELAESAIGINHLDYLVSLPWHVTTADNLDLAHAEQILDREHEGLHHLKERILEFLAVRTLNAQRKHRILVVDDEQIARDNLEHILKKEGYDVAQADSGQAALDLMDATEFDLILTDLFMAHVGGMQLLEIVKERFPDCAVIVFTGAAEYTTAVESMKKGAAHYLSKPFKIEEIRSRVREALAGKSWIHRSRGPVLCLVGPPGTGKTSLGQAVAQAMGRKFIRMSLGGVKDEAEIRGHRRSYAGAMPGRIIDAIRRVGSKNPVFMLDEIDKIGQEFSGDPASALLEVLDPEQNDRFVDHYLDVPFDLSNVMFIATANLVDLIPRPLLDRMEILSLPGYSDEEKIRIAQQFLVPRQTEAAGLGSTPPEFSPEALFTIVHHHTREAGLRNLERQIGSIYRKHAREILKKGTQNAAKAVITPEDVKRYLGPRKYYYDVTDAKDRVGVTTGLAWTETGGEIVFVEATRMRGTGELILTGQLGVIMQESARAALSYLRSNASLFHIPDDFLSDHDIHIHVPAGATPKDGPSAGLTIAFSLISLLQQRPARRDVAITGELTLTGRILPVGGVREKILAARRAGVRTVVFPERNRVDIEDLTETLKRDLDVVFAAGVVELVDLVLK